MKCVKCANNYDNVNFCPYCGYKMNNNSNYRNANIRNTNIGNTNLRNRKYSTLGILALIFTVTFFLGFIGVILAIIDLAVNGKTYKKELSIISICIFIGYSVLIFSGITNSIKSDNKIETTSNIPIEYDSIDTLEEIEEFEKLCLDFDYKKYARDPEKYTGNKVKIKVQIFDKNKGGFFDNYEYTYKAFTDDGSGYFMSDMIWLFDDRNIENSKNINILAGDKITLYGVFYGSVETQNMLNKSKGESIGFEIKYAELIDDSE